MLLDSPPPILHLLSDHPELRYILFGGLAKMDTCHEQFICHFVATEHHRPQRTWQLETKN